MQVLGLSLLIHLAAGSAQQYGGYRGYGDYEHPKHNCSVTDVVEKAEVCTPALCEHGDDRQPGVHLLVQASDGDDNDEDGGGGL